MSRKPSRKRTKPLPLDTGYWIQIGRTRHALYTYCYSTPEKAQAHAVRILDGLVTDLRRWNPEGLPELERLRHECQTVSFTDRRVVEGVIDQHTGMDIHFEFWLGTR